MKQIHKRLTYANVMSSLAVFLVLSGATALAAGLGKNSVGTKQIKNNAVTTAKIKKGAVTGAKVKNGSLTGTQINASTLGTVPAATNATNATTAANANALGGKPDTAFAASTVVRSATIEANGTVVAAKSDGIAQSNVTHAAAGFYCIKGLASAPVTSVATIGFDVEVGSTIFSEVNVAGCQVEIASYNSTKVATNEPFSVILH